MATLLDLLLDLLLDRLPDLLGDCDIAPIGAAFRALGAALKVLHPDEACARDVYGAAVFLLRPDLHIA